MGSFIDRHHFTEVKSLVTPAPIPEKSFNSIAFLILVYKRSKGRRNVDVQRSKMTQYDSWAPILCRLWSNIQTEVRWNQQSPALWRCTPRDRMMGKETSTLSSWSLYIDMNYLCVISLIYIQFLHRPARILQRIERFSDAVQLNIAISMVQHRSAHQDLGTPVKCIYTENACSLIDEKESLRNQSQFKNGTNKCGAATGVHKNWEQHWNFFSAPPTYTNNLFNDFFSRGRWNDSLIPTMSLARLYQYSGIDRLGQKRYCRQISCLKNRLSLVLHSSEKQSRTVKFPEIPSLRHGL